MQFIMLLSCYAFRSGRSAYIFPPCEDLPFCITIGAIHMFEGSVASAALFGSILGQIIAGSLADVIG